MMLAALRDSPMTTLVIIAVFLTIIAGALAIDWATARRRERSK